MIVVDTSAWVEYIRGTRSAVHERLRSLLERQTRQIAVTEVIVAELLAGVSHADAPALRDHLIGFRMLRLRGLHDFELASALYRTCRERGEPVRQLTDCLVAVPTIRAGATLLQADRDFEKLARHTLLRLEQV